MTKFTPIRMLVSPPKNANFDIYGIRWIYFWNELIIYDHVRNCNWDGSGFMWNLKIGPTGDTNVTSGYKYIRIMEF